VQPEVVVKVVYPYEPIKKQDGGQNRLKKLLEKYKVRYFDLDWRV